MQSSERRKSARLEGKVDKKIIITVPKKRIAEEGVEGAADLEEKKKRARYARAPPGSLANPNWDQMLGLDAQSKWSELLKKDKLTPLELMQEAAFTELINKRSLEALEKLENERVNEIVNRKSVFDPDERIIRFKQTNKNGQFQSTFMFPSADHYPKNFNTKISKKEAQRFQQPICPITGKPAKYRDPLTQQPYADKEAFKILREKYFQKEEEKLFIRIQVLSDLLA